MDAQQLEMIIFRYIDVNKTDEFVRQMNGWGIPLLFEAPSA